MFNILLKNPLKGLADSIGDALLRAWYSLWKLIDTLVYNLISIVYQVFTLVSRANLFDNNTEISSIVERFSVILGIGMLFVLAYNIILLIMNPDKFSSGGDKSMQGIFKNFVIAVVMLTCYSTIFNYMSKLQTDIINSQIIENIILGEMGNSNESLDKMGSKVATMIFSTFWHPISTSGEVLSYQDCLKIVASPDQSAQVSLGKIFNFTIGTEEYNICSKYIDAYDSGDAGDFASFINDSSLYDGALKGTNFEYLYLISTFCGVIALLMFVSYTIDIGIRVAKLAFLQIIAPIPIMLYVTKPKGGIFSKWISNLIKTYLSLFMRLATIYFSIFMINVLLSSFKVGDSGLFGDTSGVSSLIIMFANLIIVLGVLLFAKEAPNLFKELVGSTFSGDGGFSPKAIGKKLSGVTSAPIIGGAIGAGAHKVSQAIGAGAGAAGAAWGAWRNNRAVARGGKGAEGLSHMDVGAAATQGRHNGWKKGGLKQFNAQGQKVYEETYGYGKKQGILGGKSWATKTDEKYGKAYSANVKDHAKARNDELKAAAMEGIVPENELQTELNSRKYETQNTNFATTSDVYKNAASFVDNEAAKQGITLTDKERKAKINEKLSQIAATSTNENEKRAINSYLKREDIVTQYKDSVLTSNPEAVAKVKADAKVQAEIIAKNEISAKGVDSLITNPDIKLKLEERANKLVNEKLINAGGDISKLNISTESMKKITANAVKNAEVIITASGGIGKVTFSDAENNKINVKFNAQMNSIINDTTIDDATKHNLIDQLNTIGKDAIMKEVLIQREQSNGIKEQLHEDSYNEEAVKVIAEEKLPEVETRMMQEATSKALEDVRKATSEYVEGQLNGTYTDKPDGSKDEMYNEEYVQNEEIHSNGVKTKSAEDIAFENIKKWVKEQEKGDKPKDDKK